MKTFILVFLLLFMMSSQVYAGPQIYGYGAQPCGHFVKVLEGYRKGNDDDATAYLGFMSWFSGLATANSFDSDKDVLQGKDADAITLWLDNYCKEHPQDSFFTASVRLLTTLKNK